jgi:hypothetical protein
MERIHNLHYQPRPLGRSRGCTPSYSIPVILSIAEEWREDPQPPLSASPSRQKYRLHPFLIHTCYPLHSLRVEQGTPCSLHVQPRPLGGTRGRRCLLVAQQASGVHHQVGYFARFCLLILKDGILGLIILYDASQLIVRNGFQMPAS